MLFAAVQLKYPHASCYMWLNAFSFLKFASGYMGLNVELAYIFYQATGQKALLTEWSGVEHNEWNEAKTDVATRNL